MGVCGCGGYGRCSGYGCVRVWWVWEVLYVCVVVVGMGGVGVGGVVDMDVCGCGWNGDVVGKGV